MKIGWLVLIVLLVLTVGPIFLRAVDPPAPDQKLNEPFLQCYH